MPTIEYDPEHITRAKMSAYLWMVFKRSYHSDKRISSVENVLLLLDSGLDVWT